MHQEESGGPGPKGGGGPDRIAGDGPPLDRRTENRRALWLAIAGGVGIVIGIVALIIAIDAKNATKSDKELTAEVNKQAQVAVAGIRGQLDRDVARASAVLTTLRATSKTAKATREQLRQDVGRNRSGVAANATAIQNLQGTTNDLQQSVSSLNTQVSSLQAEVARLRSGQLDLDRRVSALEG